ncbi:MAG: hypothetical protein LBV49_09750 [Azonexus sp.]|jgi:hypothetical protein|nr:hypothetical protein [Azonexus sp.]
MNLTLILFCCVYIALAIGHFPGFRLDRTGAVLAGAMLLVASGSISPEAARAAVDYRTVGLLFGLMVMSSAFSVAGFYDWVAEKVGNLEKGVSAGLPSASASSQKLACRWRFYPCCAPLPRWRFFKRARPGGKPKNNLLQCNKVLDKANCGAKIRSCCSAT